jgi:hypothetical protein
MDFTDLLRYFTADEIRQHIKPTCQWDIDLFVRAARSTTKRERQKFITDMLRLKRITQQMAQAQRN